MVAFIPHNYSFCMLVKEVSPRVQTSVSTDLNDQLTQSLPRSSQSESLFLAWFALLSLIHICDLFNIFTFNIVWKCNSL